MTNEQSNALTLFKNAQSLVLPRGMFEDEAIFNSEKLSRFLDSDPVRAAALFYGLTSISQEGKDLVFRILAAPKVILKLARRKGFGKHIVHFLQSAQPEQRASVLAAPYAISALADNGFPKQGKKGRGMGKYIVEFLQSATLEQRALMLAAPRAIEQLADEGFGLQIIQFLDSATPEQRVAMLSAEGAVQGLTRNGYQTMDSSNCFEQKVVGFLEIMTAEQRFSILATPGVVWGLIDTGLFASPIRDLRQKLIGFLQEATPEQRDTIRSVAATQTTLLETMLKNVIFVNDTADGPLVPMVIGPQAIGKNNIRQP